MIVPSKVFQSKPLHLGLFSAVNFFCFFTHRRRESICLTEGAVSHGPNELDALPQTDLGNDATSTSGTEKLRSRCVVDLFCSYIKCTCLNVDIHSNIGTHVNTNSTGNINIDNIDITVR